MAFSTVLNLSIKKAPAMPSRPKRKRIMAMPVTTFSPAIFSTTPFQVPGVIGSALPSDEELIYIILPGPKYFPFLSQTIIFNSCRLGTRGKKEPANWFFKPYRSRLPGLGQPGKYFLASASNSPHPLRGTGGVRSSFSTPASLADTPPGGPVILLPASHLPVPVVCLREKEIGSSNKGHQAGKVFRIPCIDKTSPPPSGPPLHWARDAPSRERTQ